jgi:amidase
MTLKDQFDVSGYDSTLGYVGRAFKPAVQDCVLVSILKRMGAVIIAKSNLPQSIMVGTPGKTCEMVQILTYAVV